ncbi:MAG: hypothetical protein ACLPN1_03230 [Dissulfurispiraceae bacterium]|jgi:hypothetical protein
MFMRKSNVYLIFVSFCLILIFLMLIHASYARERAKKHLLESEELVRKLELTDLCLFTDARYTRNPAMADMHSAFQDAPMAFDHFPSGSIMPPPPHLKKYETN